MARYGGWQPGQPEPQRLADDRALMARALRSGVTIACGSDAGVFAHGDNVRELELLVAYGMTPARALQAATSVAAQGLRQPDLGRLAPGARADLVLVRADPLLDPGALRSPALVIKDGVIVQQFPAKE
jgi:imidazolonepropionase-like amidohydrolase